MVLENVKNRPPSEAGTNEEEKAEENDEGKEVSEHDDFFAKIKQALSEEVEDVRSSKRLTASPACLVSSAEQPSANLERLLQAAGQEVPKTKRILELNMEHPVIALAQKNQDAADLKDWSEMLYEQSILAEGGKLEDPSGFIKRMNEMMLKLSGA